MRWTYVDYVREAKKILMVGPLRPLPLLHDELQWWLELFDFLIFKVLNNPQIELA